MISKRLLGCKHSNPITSRVLMFYDHQSQFVAAKATSVLFKVLSRAEYVCHYANRSVGVVVVSFGVNSFLDAEFESAESIEIAPWIIRKLSSKYLLKITPQLPFSLLKNPSISDTYKNFSSFASIKSFGTFTEAILTLMQSTLDHITHSP
eukprot:TRINITY_DN10205_c0_g3_i1.p1 TRINITY_DN10205_c0_g3~~TRINITY_DN10205_c0_g3_i1.p1  ORF type:complete len:150 (-),score=5.22 TRINITY_DN10205_c0_g3_i1:519-968(-)